MKALLLAVLLTGCGCVSLPPAPVTALRLDFGDGLCSGTAVGPRTLLTAAHCVDSGALTSVNDVETHSTRIVRDGQDHALVWVDRVIGGHRLHMERPKQGEPVTWEGNPDGLRHVYREGYIAAVYPEGALVDAQGYYGDSGSGVFNARGALIGVVSAGRHLEQLGGLEMQLILLFPLQFTAADWASVR